MGLTDEMGITKVSSTKTLQALEQVKVSQPASDLLLCIAHIKPAVISTFKSDSSSNISVFKVSLTAGNPPSC